MKEIITESSHLSTNQMNSENSTTISSDLSLLSAEALALIRKDRMQTLFNKLTCIHNLTDSEENLLLQELQALEEESINGIIN